MSNSGEKQEKEQFNPPMHSLGALLLDTHKSVQAKRSKYGKPQDEYDKLSKEQQAHITDYINKSFDKKNKREGVVKYIISNKFLNPENEEEYQIYKTWINKHIATLRHKYNYEKKQNDGRRRYKRRVATEDDGS